MLFIATIALFRIMCFGSFLLYNKIEAFQKAVNKKLKQKRQIRKNSPLEDDEVMTTFNDILQIKPNYEL